ncbi:MAG TPA: DoxX family membrane protein [Solirubrobacteraceae bacterium]|jgi:putative oxidoreductase|nr:DoxX family membrane protein [Solirubrobacteraceae bacterium]
MKIFRLLLRVTIGALFVGHGSQKLFGWFGGGGLKATAAGFDQMGMRPGLANAIAAGTAEAGGGALVAAGFLTPLGSASIIGTMLTAIHRVHLQNGPWVTKGGYEYNLVLILTLITLVEVGPGPVSLDALKGQERKGDLWALASLAVGGAGAAAAHFASAALAPAPPEQS